MKSMHRRNADNAAMREKMRLCKRSIQDVSSLITSSDAGNTIKRRPNRLVDRLRTSEIKRVFKTKITHIFYTLWEKDTIKMITFMLHNSGMKTLCSSSDFITL